MHLFRTMKTLLLSFALFFSIPGKTNDFYDQLLSINSNWKNFAMHIPDTEAKNFRDENSFIQTHLQTVESVLAQADLSALSEKQKLARQKNLLVLHAYILAGKFPQNKYLSYRNPVFIDECNTHCAVGFLMQASGNEALAKRISVADNYVFVKNITDPELQSWQEASGFSLEELELIQPAYAAPATAFEQAYACTTVYFEGQWGYNYNWNSIGEKQEEPKKQTWYSGECENGVLNGKWEQYHSPGKIWIRGNFKNGKKDGEWNWYTYTGTEKEVPQKRENWKDGKREGVFITWDYAKQKASEGYYVNDLKEGVWTYWQSGHVLKTENYSEGKLDGNVTQYYFNPADTIEKKIAQNDFYKNGTLEKRASFTQQGQLSLIAEHISLREYRVTQYNSAGMISMKGWEDIFMRTDSSEDMMYPNLPKRYYEVEMHIKKGRWSLYPPIGHYLLYTDYAQKIDSAYLWFERDSIRRSCRFLKSGNNPQKDSVVYASLRSLYPNSYYNPPGIYAQESWSYQNGKLVAHTATWPDNASKFRYFYTNGEISNANRTYRSGEYYETWSGSTVAGKIVLTYQQFDTKRRLLMKGPIMDTTMRYGAWEFYDTLGTVIAKGEYLSGLKEGEWTETYPDGTTWKGKYQKGKKKGTWEQVSPKEAVIRREKF